MSRFFKSAAFPILIVVVLAFFAQKLINPGDRAPKPEFSDFLAQLNTGEVKSVNLKTKDNTVQVTLKNDQKYEIGYPDDYGNELVNKLQAKDVRFNVEGRKTNGWLSLLTYVLPFLIFIGFWIFLMNQVQGGGSKVMSFGKSRAKRMSVDSPKITFRDVAGVDEAVEELHEIKEFLENPKKFQALGARIPKGVLLFGPPGTGKTLLARAVAGEAGVPFFSISGSDFVEMFVGVGASRVRDLFEQAKQNSPCIIFMDEIDAVGRHRGAGLGGGHDEREQTLNQLLVEMDGFEMKDNIILIAATNRPDILDPALLRPGRFDRQIVVDRPDRKGRAKILEVHTRGKPLAREIDIDALAGQTPGFTGADLSNLVNEAALLAARNGRREIGQHELEEGIMRVIAGPEKKTRVMSDKERLITAYHEMGHAIVGHYLPNSDPVHKISIISRGQALGYTISLPQEDKFLTTRAELTDTMAMTLGGRAAEEIVFGEITTGASNDIEKVTAHRQADGHALRDEREARPARVRPRPRPAVPRPRVLLRARLLRRDRARDRRRDPPHRRGRAPAGARHPHRPPRRARAHLADPRQARDDREGASSRRCSPGEPRTRSSRPRSRPARAAGPAGARRPRPWARRPAPAAASRARRRHGAIMPRATSARQAVALTAAPRLLRSWAWSTSRPTRSPTAAGSSTPARRSRTARGSRARAPTSSTSAASRRGRAPSRSARTRSCGAWCPVVEELARGDGRRLDRHLQGGGRRGGARAPAPRYVNDVTALRGDPEMAALVAGARRRVLPDAHARRAAHDAGRPALRRRRLRRQGLPGGAARVRRRRGRSPRSEIMLDPGIGFGKTVEHNLELLRRLDEIVAARAAGRGRHLAQVLPRPASPGARSASGCRGRSPPTCSRSSAGRPSSASTTSRRCAMRSRWPLLRSAADGRRRTTTT